MLIVISQTIIIIIHKNKFQMSKIVENVEYESGSGNLSQQAIKRLTRSTSRVFLLQAAE